jgi:hypothetical protein
MNCEENLELLYGIKDFPWGDFERTVQAGAFLARSLGIGPDENDFWALWHSLADMTLRAYQNFLLEDTTMVHSGIFTVHVFKTEESELEFSFYLSV